MKDHISEQEDREVSIRAHDKFLRIALDNMLEGIQIIGFDWRYIYVNNAFALHGKYPKEDFVGATVMEKYPGIEQTEVYKVYQRCFNERVPIHMENRFVFPDNSIGWFELSFEPVPEGLLILSIDITERKKSEEAILQINAELEQRVKDRTAELEEHIRQLKENEEKFQKAFQASAAAMSITRLSDSVYVDVNEAFVKMTGASYEELIGHTSVEVGFIADFEKRQDALKQVRDKGSLKDFEISILNKAGQKLNVLSSIETTVVNGERYAINIIYDITARTKAEEQLAAANKELEAFSYSVSHDLKAPLRAVNGFAEMLEYKYGNILDDEGKRLLGVIQSKAKRMTVLIDDILSFSKLGGMAVERTDIDMNALTEEVVGELGRTIEHAAKIEIRPLHPAKGEPVLIKQVLVNLIANAVKYSSKVAAPEVMITSKELGSEIVYSVQDNGVGFDMRYANKLFGAFERLHSMEEFEGTGIGLATVKRIVTNHGGKIWADSAPDKGATFSFSLPK